MVADFFLYTLQVKNTREWRKLRLTKGRGRRKDGGATFQECRRRTSGGQEVADSGEAWAEVVELQWCSDG